MNKVTTFAAVVFALTALATPALAQTTVQGGQFRHHRVVDDTLNRKGRWELGLNGAGAMSFSRATSDDESSRLSNVYVTASLVGGYMIHDHVELRLTVGLQYAGQSFDDEYSVSSPAFVGTVQALYQRDLVLGLALYAGVGIGGFYGSRTEDAPGGLEFRFKNAGGLGQALLGLMAMPGPRLLFRAGLRADMLFGQESPEDDLGGTLSETTFFTTQILFDVAIGLRFG